MTLERCNTLGLGVLTFITSVAGKEQDKTYRASYIRELEPTVFNMSLHSTLSARVVSRGNSYTNPSQLVRGAEEDAACFSK
jgi:hypothetical protein